MADDGNKGKIEDEFFGTPLTTAMAMPFNLAVGDIILGRVSKVDDEYVYVSTGFKSEGRIPVEEFKDSPEGEVGYKLDDEVEVMVDRIAGEDIYLSYESVLDRRRWEELIRQHEEKEPIEGIVKQQVKGGYRLDVGVSRHAFLPGSHLGLQVNDFDAELKDKPLRVVIIEINPDSENIVVSHRELRKRELAEKESEFFANIEIDSIIEGKVTRLTNFGAFVDVGGVEGLVHISELAWNRVGHPSQVLSCGDVINVKVLNVDEEAKKISLSLKEATEDPWNSITQTFSIDEVIKGTVSKVVKFGAFIRLNKDFEGLLHISEIQASMSGNRAKLNVGEEIKVKILNIDQENKRIKLGLVAALAANVPKEMKQYIDDGKSSFTIGDALDGALDEQEK